MVIINDKERYRLSQYSFKEDEIANISRIMTSIFTLLKSMGMPNFFEDGKYEPLTRASLKQLNEVASWVKLAHDLDLIHFKCSITKEYYYITVLAKEAKSLINQIVDIVERLESDLKTDYSQIVTGNDFFLNYFSYKEFKQAFIEMTSPKNITLPKAIVLKKERMFNMIRKKIISDKSNIHYLLAESEKSIIHINDIRKQDSATFDLIRSEFFMTLCEETMNLKIPYGRKAKTEIIRPSHVLAEKLRMQRSELIYLTVSLEPIEDVELEEMDVIEFSNGSKFEVTVPQQMVHREMFYQLKLDDLSVCNLVVPVYFSFIRCNLVKEQRTYNPMENSDTSKFDDAIPDTIHQR